MHSISSLAGLEERIDGHEHGTVGRRTEGGDHRFGALVQVDRYTFAAPHAEGRERRRKALDQTGGVCVGRGHPFVGEGSGLRRSQCRHQGQLMQQACFTNH